MFQNFVQLRKIDVQRGMLSFASIPVTLRMLFKKNQGVGSAAPSSYGLMGQAFVLIIYICSLVAKGDAHVEFGIHFISMNNQPRCLVEAMIPWLSKALRYNPRPLGGEGGGGTRIRHPRFFVAKVRSVSDATLCRTLCISSLRLYSNFWKILSKTVWFIPILVAWCHATLGQKLVLGKSPKNKAKSI